MICLGANIYYWGRTEQNDLLLRGVRPWAIEARSRDLAQRLWYCRFDARGPHLFVLLTASNREALDELRRLLESHIREFLLHSPSTAELTVEEIERRHRECRGKALCHADRMEHLAANNSFEIFEHEPDEYPLWLSSGMAAAESFWNRLDEITFWTFRYLDNGSATTAIRWLAMIDHSLQQRALPREFYWRYHASTLIPALDQRLEGQSREEVKSMLQQTLAEKHTGIFSRVWFQEGTDAGLDIDVDGVVEPVVADDGRTLERRFGVLREVNHMVLGQLGQPVNVQIPMVLYAWQRSLS
jgi:hypothetical protein